MSNNTTASSDSVSSPPPKKHKADPELPTQQQDQSISHDQEKSTKQQDQSNSHETPAPADNFPPKLYYVIVHTNDLKSSSAFFQKHFGFTGTEVAEWSELESQQEFGTKLAFHPRAPPQDSASAIHLGVVVPKLQPYHEKLIEDKEVKVIRPPTKEPWGGFKAEYESPDGVNFSVIEDFSGSHNFDGIKKKDNKEKGAGICHLDIPVQDTDRAKKFYGDIFGWSFHEYTPVYTLFDSHNPEFSLKGGLDKTIKTPFSNPFVHLAVSDIESTLTKIKEAGGEILKPKFEIGPGIGFNGHFKDTEGNALGLYSRPL